MDNHNHRYCYSHHAPIASPDSSKYHPLFNNNVNSHDLKNTAFSAAAAFKSPIFHTYDPNWIFEVVNSSLRNPVSAAAASKAPLDPDWIFEVVNSRLQKNAAAASKSRINTTQEEEEENREGCCRRRRRAPMISSPHPSELPLPNPEWIIRARNSRRCNNIVPAAASTSRQVNEEEELTPSLTGNQDYSNNNNPEDYCDLDDDSEELLLLLHLQSTSQSAATGIISTLDSEAESSFYVGPSWFNASPAPTSLPFPTFTSKETVAINAKPSITAGITKNILKPDPNWIAKISNSRYMKNRLHFRTSNSPMNSKLISE